MSVGVRLRSASVFECVRLSCPCVLSIAAAHVFLCLGSRTRCLKTWSAKCTVTEMTECEGQEKENAHWLFSGTIANTTLGGASLHGKATVPSFSQDISKHRISTKKTKLYIDKLEKN